jgi:hypothetical protein
LEGTLFVATAKPAACSVELALATFWPTTLGTAIGTGPLETFNVTVEPWSTEAPEEGFWSITVSAGLLESTRTTLAFKCASFSAATASVEESPITLGTVVCGFPEEDVIVTCAPLFSFVPGCGSWRKT